MLKWWCSCVAASVDWTAVRRWSADDAATASCSAAATAAAAAAIWQLCCWHCTRTLCQRLPGHRCHDISRQADGFDKGPTFGHWLSVSHNCCSFSTVYFIFKIVFVNSFIQPSLRLCKPTYSVLVPKPRNRESCGKKSIQRKNTLGCMAGLTGTRCGCRRPASDHSTVRGVTEMGPAVNQGPRQMQSIKVVWVLVLGILVVSFGCFLWVFPCLSPINGR